MTNKNLKTFLGQGTKVICREEKVNAAVLKAKEAYCLSEAEGRLSGMEFLYLQSRYIRKCWWILQGLLLLSLWLFLKFAESGYYMQRSIGAAAPLFAILILPEIWKNKSMNALEIEGASYYSLRQVYAARFLLFALVDLGLLCAFFFAASAAGKLMLGELAVQFLVPFNVTCCICFRMLYSKRGVSESFALLLCMVWALIWLTVVLRDNVYRLISAPAWAAMLVFSALYLVYTVRRGQKHCIELWEVKVLWN